MSRANEIAQGLREESGSLTFPLDVIEYAQGHSDFLERKPPPTMSSPSYDLGRNRARENAEVEAGIKEQLRQEGEYRISAMREILKDHPDALAEYLAKVEELSRG